MEHIPVLLHEAIDLLSVKESGTYVDLTLGRGGHSEAILKRLGEKGRLFAFDVDPTAIAESAPRLELTGKHFQLIEANFATFEAELKRRGVKEVDGILMDLGVSSPDFDDPSRGFSYMEEGPLDMRMDPTLKESAFDVVNSYGERRLGDVIRLYGEDYEARKIAHAIVLARENGPIKTTTELAEIVVNAKSPKERAKKGHPAKQTFQAIRIEVNHELDVLEKALDSIPRMLAPGGRAAVISFHSLEDTLVKRAFRSLTRNEKVGRNDPNSYLISTSSPAFLDLTPRPIVPSLAEQSENRRSLSAKLRGIEKKKGVQDEGQA